SALTTILTGVVAVSSDRISRTDPPVEHVVLGHIGAPQGRRLCPSGTYDPAGRVRPRLPSPYGYDASKFDNAGPARGPPRQLRVAGPHLLPVQPERRGR